MKSELELNLDQNGRPCIKIRHHDKDISLEQKALWIFIDGVMKNGCVIEHVSGYIETGTDRSWENYEIQIKKPNVTNLVIDNDPILGDTYLTECCKRGPITDEKYCPYCGKKIIRL
jgi:hypothetical protein